MSQEIANLVELVFDISTLIPDQKYLEIMKSIQKINDYKTNTNNNEPSEFELLYYKLNQSHNRLKKNYRRIAKQRKEQMEAMEETIEQLQHHIQYLEQEKPKEMTYNDYVNSDTILV